RNASVPHLVRIFRMPQMRHLLLWWLYWRRRHAVTLHRPCCCERYPVDIHDPTPRSSVSVSRTYDGVGEPFVRWLTFWRLMAALRVGNLRSRTQEFHATMHISLVIVVIRNPRLERRRQSASHLRDQ